MNDVVVCGPVGVKRQKRLCERHSFDRVPDPDPGSFDTAEGTGVVHGILSVQKGKGPNAIIGRSFVPVPCGMWLYLPSSRAVGRSEPFFKFCDVDGPQGCVHVKTKTETSRPQASKLKPRMALGFPHTVL